MACKVHYIEANSDEESSQSICAFFFKILVKALKLSLVSRMRASDKNDERKLEFGFKKVKYQILEESGKCGVFGGYS